LFFIRLSYGTTPLTTLWSQSRTTSEDVAQVRVAVHM
jgi:hypothetical protein